MISCKAKEGYQTGLAWEWSLLAGLSSVRMRSIGAQGAGRGLSICPVGPLLDLQSKVELRVGGGWGLGKVQLGVFITGWDFYHWVGFKVCGGSGHPLPARHFFSLRWCWPRWLFPEAPFPHTAPPGWPGVGMAPPHTRSRGSQALGFLSLSGQAYWRKTALRPFFKTGNCSPCFLEDRNCPHGNCGTKRPH